MQHGRIVEHGTFRDLLARGVDFHAELDDGQPTEPAVPSTPEALGGPTASPARTPVSSAVAGSTASSGAALPNPSPAKPGQTPQAAGPKFAAPVTTLQKRDLIKVGSHSHMQLQSLKAGICCR